MGHAAPRLTQHWQAGYRSVGVATGCGGQSRAQGGMRRQSRLAALHGEEADLRVVPSADSFRVEIRMPARGQTNDSASTPISAK